jgi:hypothetical protein
MNEREAVKRKTSVQVDGDSIGGNSKERLRGRPSKTKQTRGSYAGYPRHSLEKALRIPKAILEQNAGKECSDAEAAKFSGVGCHGPFRLEISSSVKFGLLERPSPGRLKITELARKILRPQQIITIEPGKRGGKPCVRRMRITVSNVLGWLAAG